MEENLLAPYRVLDLTDEKGLFCSQLLGSLGADVIKVEKPGGDPSRKLGPFFQDIPDPEKSLFWFAFSANKRGITLDIETADGREILKRLIETADIVVESFPVGYMNKLELGYPELEKVNPQIILTSVSPFGQEGPHKNYKVSDLVCSAMGGFLFTSGDREMPPVQISHIPAAYLLGSVDGAWGTVMALYWRGLSAQGQHVDVSIQETMARSNWMVHERRKVTGSEYQRHGSSYMTSSGVLTTVVWPTKDGYVVYAIHGGQQGAYRNPRMVKWLEDEGIADNFIRSMDWSNLDWRLLSQEEVERIHNYYSRLFRSKTNAELFEEALKRRVELQPVCTPKDILSHPQLEARGYWQKVEHDDLGINLTYPGSFCKPLETTCKIRRRAPLIGEHNQEIYQGELGLSKEELIILKEGGII